MLEYVDKVSPEYLGKVDEYVYKKFVTAQSNVSLLQQRIGLLEVQKAEMIRMIAEESKKATELMSEEARRLKVPESAEWHITKDGEAFLGKAPENQV